MIGAVFTLAPGVPLTNSIRNFWKMIIYPV